MNDFDDLISAGMAQATGVLGEPITIDKKPYTAIVDNFRLTRAMQEAGFDPGYTLTVVITLAQMETLPPFDARAVFGTYKGRAIQVKNGEIDDAGVTLYLVDVK